jgi:hypothetical protein
MGPYYGLQQILVASGNPIKAILQTRHWCVKTYPNEREGLGLLRLYPKIRFLYIYRNGCSVVNSMSHFGQMKKREFESNCEIWARHVEKYEYLLGLDEALVVRQEDLLEDPGTLFDQVQTFLGLDQDDRLAEYCRSTLVHPLNDPTKEGIDALEILKARPVPYADWSREQRLVFKSICGPGMHKLGYKVPF